jgi:hypothetical protein
MIIILLTCDDQKVIRINTYGTPSRSLSAPIRLWRKWALAVKSHNPCPRKSRGFRSRGWINDFDRKSWNCHLNRDQAARDHEIHAAQGPHECRRSKGINAIIWQRSIDGPYSEVLRPWALLRAECSLELAIPGSTSCWWYRYQNYGYVWARPIFEYLLACWQVWHCSIYIPLSSDRRAAFSAVPSALGVI